MQPAIERMIGQIAQFADGADDLDALKRRLADLYPDLDATEVTETMRDAGLATRLTGVDDAGE